jgi:hypothetical protein
MSDEKNSAHVRHRSGVTQPRARRVASGCQSESRRTAARRTRPCAYAVWLPDTWQKDAERPSLKRLRSLLTRQRCLTTRPVSAERHRVTNEDAAHRARTSCTSNATASMATIGTIGSEQNANCGLWRRSGSFGGCRRNSDAGWRSLWVVRRVPVLRRPSRLFLVGVPFRSDAWADVDDWGDVNDTCRFVRCQDPAGDGDTILSSEREFTMDDWGRRRQPHQP